MADTNLPTEQQPAAPQKLKHIGRPRKWTDPEQIYSLADQYFDECIQKQQPITITGLSEAIGTTRKQLIEYETDHNGTGADSDAIRNAVKHVKHRCERYAEEHGYQARNPAFAIFALKNYGWKDTQTVETVGFIEHRADPETLKILGDFLCQLSAPRQADVISVTDTRQNQSAKLSTSAETAQKLISERND